MAIVEQQRSAASVPFAMGVPDRVPNERYYDADFYAAEAEHLWPRVWQMACRLEEIPEPGDFVEYEILDQSVVVVRTDDLGVTAFDPRAWLDGELQYLRTMSEGMAGMVHADDVRVAERLVDIELPADPTLAMATWHRTLNDAVVSWHRAEGHDVPDLNELEAQGRNEPMGYVFPHWFVLPMYSGASSYRFRPLGPEETLMQIWSLTRFPEGEEPGKPSPPDVWQHDDPRWPPIPAQDFSNLPRQQKGLHAQGFEYMRLSESMEGHISNFHRVIDGFLAGLPYERLLPALQHVNVNPLEMPVVDLGL